MKICPDCLSNYKHSKIGRHEKKSNGAWGKNKWPLHIYHNELTKKCLKHHSYAVSYSSSRRNNVEKQTPKWANIKLITKIYEECFLMNKNNLDKYEVDHIIPISGKLVCGFHVENNLRIIKAADNRKKSNSFKV